MALVSPYWVLEVQLVDRGGNDTTRTYRFRDTDDAGDMDLLATAANALIVALQLVTDAVIKKYQLAKVFINDAFALPSVGEVEAHALITAPILDLPQKSASIDIPAPKDSIFVGSSGAAYNQVDFADAAVIGYLNEFTGATSPFLVSDGEAIEQVNLRGKRTHSRSTKG